MKLWREMVEAVRSGELVVGSVLVALAVGAAVAFIFGTESKLLLIRSGGGCINNPDPNCNAAPLVETIVNPNIWLGLVVGLVVLLLLLLLEATTVHRARAGSRDQEIDKGT